MNTHNDFLNNAVDDELETEGIENLITDVCSDMQNDTEKMCLSLQNGTCGDGCNNVKKREISAPKWRISGLICKAAFLMESPVFFYQNISTEKSALGSRLRIRCHRLS